MSERKAGWYWVRGFESDVWEVAEFTGGETWFINAHEGAVNEVFFEEIGPRIPTPDEPWQTVPKAPTPDMLEKGVDMLDVTDNLIPTYQAMLWAAPKPEDT